MKSIIQSMNTVQKRRNETVSVTNLGDLLSCVMSRLLHCLDNRFIVCGYVASLAHRPCFTPQKQLPKYIQVLISGGTRRIELNSFTSSGVEPTTFQHVASSFSVMCAKVSIGSTSLSRPVACLFTE